MAPRECSMRVARHVRSAVSHEEIEIGALVGLLDMFDVEPQPPRSGRGGGVHSRGGRPIFVIDIQTEPSAWEHRA